MLKSTKTCPAAKSSDMTTRDPLLIASMEGASLSSVSSTLTLRSEGTPPLSTACTIKL